MFYTLGNILSPQSRRAEQTDTRQEIQRHDPEYERRKGQKQDKKEDINFEDGAIVSVEALKDFLENFVRERAQDTQSEETKTPSSDETNEALTPRQSQPEKTQTRTPVNNPAAQAANAYAQSAHINDHDKVLLETTDKADGPPLDLSAADIRTLHALIEDLKILQAAKIETIKLERADSFIESLVNATQKSKSQL